LTCNPTLQSDRGAFNRTAQRETNVVVVVVVVVVVDVAVICDVAVVINFNVVVVV